MRGFLTGVWERLQVPLQIALSKFILLGFILVGWWLIWKLAEYLFPPERVAKFPILSFMLLLMEVLSYLGSLALFFLLVWYDIQEYRQQRIRQAEREGGEQA